MVSARLCDVVLNLLREFARRRGKYVDEFDLGLICRELDPGLRLKLF